MIFSRLLLPALLFCSVNAVALHHNTCSDLRIDNGVRQRGTLASPLELLYDVHYVKIDVELSNINTSIKGNSTTMATVVDPVGMSQYAFELNDTLTIDSAKMNGTLVTVINNGNHVHTIGAVVPVPFNTTFTAQIFYHGIARNGGTGFFNGGIVQQTLASGTNITYTMSDDYFAKDWWASKQVLQDKIDSVDIWVTAPAGNKVGCNGLLQQITSVGAANRYEWKTRYPIDYYLISAAVAPYADRSSYMHFSNSSDSMLVQHYIYDTTTLLPQIAPALDSTGFMIDHFSSLFGRYPFWKEKYGHCTAPLGGGMEHQTMTTLGSYATPLIAHELGHQWWGDHVTYASWRDIWMSEGWASYCEQLFVEHFRGSAAAQSYRTAAFNRVMNSVGGTVYVNDTSNVLRTFDSRLTYDKGAAVAHMLRFVAPDDATYFSALQSYQNQYAFRNASTEEFKAELETAYGADLDTFFNQWVYGEGYPIYTAKWNQDASNKVYLQIKQTTSVPASVALFVTPLEIKIAGANADTVIRIYSNAAQQNISFTWSKTMTSMSIDPNNHILNKAGSITKDPTLAVNGVSPSMLRVYPNPARDSWQVSGYPVATRLVLYNVSGQKIWDQIPVANKVTIPAANLPAGHYELQFIQEGKTTEMHQLIHW